MALLFIVHVPYKPDDDETGDNFTKNYSEVKDDTSPAKESETVEKNITTSSSTSDKIVEDAAEESKKETVDGDIDKPGPTDNTGADITNITKCESVPEISDNTENTTQDETIKTDNDITTTTDVDADITADDGTKSVNEETEKVTNDASTDKDIENTDNKPDVNPLVDAPLTPLIQKVPIHREVEAELEKLNVDNIDIHFVDDGKSLKFSFVEEDSQRSELILNKLRTVCVGQSGANISVFPASLHENFGDDLDGLTKGVKRAQSDLMKNNPSDEVAQKESIFRKSVKSRLLVAQVVKSVTDNAYFTFDYLLLLILASLISCIGLVENSSVVLVASMLISPLMGPILATTFGQVIHKIDLRNLGLKSEMRGLGICLIIGFTFGLISGGVGLHGAVWGSTDAWPTSEMKSRGMLRSLWVGMLIALPSGAGVAISVLGGNAGSLVGVAISASLLPPACNAGMLWAYALLAAISPPDVVSSTLIQPISNITSTTNDTQVILSNSTLLNATTSNATISSTTALPPLTTTPTSTSLVCQPLYDNAYEPVYFCNVAQEAALLGLVARTYYQTARGETSKSLGKMFLDEYKKIQVLKQKSMDKVDEDSTDMAYELCTIELRNLIQAVESSSDCQNVISKLQNRPMKGVTEELDNEYNEAALRLSHMIEKKRTHHTYHHVPQTSRPGIEDIKAAFKSRKTLSLVIEPEVLDQIQPFGFYDGSALKRTTSLEILSEDKELETAPKSYNKRSFHLMSPKNSKIVRKRKPKVKFQVTKVDEEENLV
ncbi:hypothetical protein ACF0H5_004975 [Mactra antiquata]